MRFFKILCTLLIVGISSNVIYGLYLTKNISTIEDIKTEEISFENVKFQTVSVHCKDTENYGHGANRNRVCAHRTTAFCDWENWHPPATNGTCTLGDGDPE